MGRRAFSVAADERRRSGSVPGETGVWVVILGELTIFALFFGAYVAAQGRDPELFATGQAHLHQWRAVVNTVLLLSSSLCVARAVQAVRDGRPERARPSLAVAVAGGTAFLLVKIVEYGDLFRHDLTPATNEFFTYYFVLTWVHLLHLVLGMGISSPFDRCCGGRS